MAQIPLLYSRAENSAEIRQVRACCLKIRVRAYRVIVIKIIVGAELLRICNLVVETNRELVAVLVQIVEHGHVSVGVGDRAKLRNKLVVKRNGCRIKTRGGNLVVREYRGIRIAARRRGSK